MRFIYLFFIALICLLHSNTTHAQCIVSGAVKDKANSAVPYATVMLQQLPDSMILATTVADSVGSYKLETAKKGKAFLFATAVGYIQTGSVPDLHTGMQTADIVLAKDVLLKEVSVSSRKALIERKTDRIIFNVENSIASTGTDALEAISKAPGVRVNSTDDITIVGKSTVNVMLNDKLLQLSGDELAEMLCSIPSENISRIEVITTPPAKYDAAGNSGLINIVTKKQSKQGLNGTVGFTYMQTHLSSALPMATFNYRKNKWNIYGNTNFGDNYSKPVERYTGYYPGQTWAQVNNIDNLHNFHYSQLGADYNITPKAIIGFLYTYAGSTPRKNEDITGRWTDAANNTDSIINTKARTHDFGERNVVNVNYVWNIDTTGKKLNVDGDFFTRTGRTVREFTTTDMYSDGTSTGTNSTDKSTGRQVLYIGSAKADVELPVKFAKLSFGGKASMIHVISDNVFEYLSPGGYVVDPGKSNQFDYRENTQALYLSGQKKINSQWDAQAGLRAEYTQTQAASITLNQSNETKYMKLFPTCYIQYTHDEDNVLNLNYSRRIERPNMVMINPFRVYMTPTSFSEGNPFLQPSFSSNVELSYTLKSKYSFTVYTQQIQQMSTQVLQIDTLNKGYYFTYANIGTSLNSGISASAAFTPTKWWECNAQLYGFHTHVNANYYNSAVHNEYDQDGFTVEGDNTFTLNRNKTLMAECGFSYVSTMIENYNYHYPNYNINAGMRALLLKRNLVIGFNVNDIFRTEVIKISNLYNKAVTNNYYDERMLHVNVTYKFGNKNVRAKRDRSGGAMEESKRM